VAPFENEPDNLEVLVELDMTHPMRDEMLVARTVDEELQELAHTSNAVGLI
jgi:hypothetical protein